MASTSVPKFFMPESAFSAADLRNFTILETAFGDALWEVLRAYMRIGEQACEKLQEATACAHWQEAVRLALKIASTAADLDLRPVTDAARAFTTAVYEDNTAHTRRNAAQMVVLEFEKSCLMLASRYPGLVETGGTSIA